MARRTRKSKPSIYRLHVSLTEVEGPIWRRVLVPSNIRLGELHLTLNEVMGWTNSHLHQFVFGKRTFGDPNVDLEGKIEDEGAVSLDELVGEKGRFIYEYDFGDDWIHTVVVEKKVEVDPRVTYPICIGGSQACPPEDCGGPPGYEHLLEVLQDEESGEHHDLVEWLGGFFDPEGFDVNRTNQALHNPL